MGEGTYIEFKNPTSADFWLQTDLAKLRYKEYKMDPDFAYEDREKNYDPNYKVYLFEAQIGNKLQSKRHEFTENEI